MPKNSKKYTAASLAMFAAGSLVYAWVCYILFHVKNHPDFTDHIAFALEPEYKENGYSLLHTLIRLFHRLAPSHIGLQLTLCMTGCILAAIYLSYLLLLQLSETREDTPGGVLCMLLAWLCNVSMALYAPGAERVYLGTLPAGSIWHNPTFILLKPLAVLSVLSFLWLYRGYETAIHVKSYALFAISLFLATWAKPNFTICFALGIGVLLLFDLVRARGRNRVLLLGVAVLPSVGLVLWQTLMLFDGQTSSIAFGLMVELRCFTEHPYFGLLRSLAFPLVVFVFLYKKKYMAGHTLLIVTGFTGVLYSVCLHEVGPRFGHGNLFWSGYIGVYMLFLSASAILCQTTRQGLGWGNGSNSVAGKRTGRFLPWRFSVTAAWLLVLWHAVVGVYYLGQWVVKSRIA